MRFWRLLVAVSRASQSFLPEEIEVAVAIIRTVRLGGDARVLLDRKEGRRLAAKFEGMKRRLPEPESAEPRQSA